jgi:hypothetical protein
MFARIHKLQLAFLISLIFHRPRFQACLLDGICFLATSEIDFREDSIHQLSEVSADLRVISFSARQSLELQ